MTKAVHVFVYGDERNRAIDHVASEPVADAAVQGTLFDIDGVGHALMLAGTDRIRGQVRRIAPADLERLDARARVREGIYRRVGVEIGGRPCWTWVAGPLLAPRLKPELRVRGPGMELP